MKYYIKSVIEYIDEQLNSVPGTGNRFQMMIPSLPAPETLELANRLTQYCSANDIQLDFKVAHELAQEWTPQEQNDVKINNYWVEGSLTGLRNTINTSDKNLLLILVGSARVTDKGSLSDFHQCDLNNLWIAQLKQSFAGWLEDFFNEYNLLFNDAELEQANGILKELVARYDILKISSFLENVNVDSASAKEAIGELLTQLDTFGLPNLSNCIYQSKRKESFRYYATSAKEFFSYNAFLEPSKREDALKRIEKFIDEAKKDIQPEQITPFESQEVFFDTLKRYIAENDDASRKLLPKCDFVFIWEDILKYKPKKEKPEKQTVKKLSGSPLEVFLHAVYIALGKAYTNNITKISIVGKKFRHDCYADELNQSEKAQQLLIQMLGGLDDVLKTHIQIFRNEDGDTVEIASELLNDTIAFESSKTGEPYFEFQITLEQQSAEDMAFSEDFKFALRLPEIHPYRLAADLITLAQNNIADHSSDWLYPIPVFHLNYYQELMAAKDEEEICRILLHCINDCDSHPGVTPFMENLFTETWRTDHPDELKTDLEKIAFEYKQFIAEAKNSGFYTALNGKADALISAYHQAAEHFVKEEKYQKSTKLAAMLFRSFLVVGEHRNEVIDTWGVQPYEKDAVITILHPSLIEMVQAQCVFLLRAFSTLVNEALASGKPKFKENQWQYYVDMAEIQMPLGGLLTDSNGVLSIDVRGKNLLHRILDKNTDPSGSIATRLMTRYDHIDEDDISDSEIFKETRESKLLLRILNDYRIMHPHARDGICLAVYRNDDIQPVLSALNSYLKNWVKPAQMKNGQKYAVSLVLFSDFADDTGIANYLEEWQERWEAAENEDKLKHYSYCSLSVAHRIVSTTNNRAQFEKILREEFDCDIFVFYNFIAAGQDGNKFKPVAPYDSTRDTLKFPILEKSFCSQATPDEKLTRTQIISNRQFKINADHTEIMARLKNQYTQTDQYHVILGTGNFAEWQRIIDTAHEAAEWVVCIDANIDDKLLKEINPIYQNQGKQRELIGFGSGVGVHGESNYTISTQQFSFADLKVNLRNNFKNTFTYGSDADDIVIVDQLVSDAQKLSGLSIIRALGPSYYRCDLLAYSLVYKLLPITTGGHLCNQIFSIDAYRHWFDLSSTDSEKHPDLLWMRADITPTGKFAFKMTLIECKMVKENNSVLDKAQEQIQNGLDVLIKAFRPRQNDQEVPDGRYWYLQLHRLIACSARNVQNEEVFLAAMERLSAGDFEISWTAGVFAFWTDSKQPGMEEVECWDIESNDESYEVSVYTIGYNFIKSICNGMASPIVNWDEKMVTFDSSYPSASDIEERPIEIPEPDDEEEVFIEPPCFDPETAEDKTEEKSPEEPQKETDSDDKYDEIKDPDKANLQPVVVHDIPQRIFLGKENGKDFYWEFGHPKLNNRHLLIFGSSGMGKTYAIQTILCEFGRQMQNSLIVDYTNGFLPNQLEAATSKSLNPRQSIVKVDKIPIDPFAKQKQNITESITIEDNSMDVAKRVTSIFNSVYNMGDQQTSILIDAIQYGIDSGNMHLDALIPILESFLDDNVHSKATVQKVISKLKPFISESPFTGAQNNNWQDIFDAKEHLCNVFQLAGVDKDTSRILIEFILWDLYAYACNSSTEKTPKVIVLDEVQNLDHKLEAPLGKILTEGRKFGLCLIAATQTLSNLDKDQQARLFQAGHKLFFGPNAPEANQYAELVMQVANSGTKEQWKTKLMSLQKGECLSIGPVLNEKTGDLRVEVHKIKISSLAERGF